MKFKSWTFALTLAAVVLLVALGFAGCSKDAYRIAAQLGDDVGAAVNNGATAVENIRVAGGITPDEERTVLGYFSTVNTLNGTYLTCVAGAHAAGNAVPAFESCASTFLAAADNPATLAAIHISNPNSQAKVMTAVQGIQTVIQAAETTLAGIK